MMDATPQTKRPAGTPPPAAKDRARKSHDRSPTAPPGRPSSGDCGGRGGMDMDKVKTWVGKKVVCVNPERESSPTRRKLLKIGQVYEVEDVSVGNYWACIRLKGMPTGRGGG